MKKLLFVILGLSMLSFGSAYAEEHDRRDGGVHDRRDLEDAHEHIVQTINELDRAAEANHYDMHGHAGRAVELLHQAEHELHEAIESARERR